MPVPTQSTDQWWVNDQTPDNPFGKSEDYEAFLDYLGALDRSLTPDLAAGPLRINVTELNDHPDYKAAAIGALEAWSTVTPLEFEIVDDAPFNAETDWIEVVSPELGEPDDDTVNAHASTLPLVVFGGQGNDAIHGGTGGDLVFGDRGLVLWFDAAKAA